MVMAVYNKSTLLIGLLLFFLILAIPNTWMPIAGITTVGQRLGAIFVLACIFWVFEPIPAFTTSVLIIFLQLVLVSTQAIIWLHPAEAPSNFGHLLAYQEIIGVFASPIIILFLGGFFLAIAATKYRLDLNLAKILIKPFGQKPAHVVLGLMIITALFSMFMSNTATTAMMFAIVSPVLALYTPHDKGRVAMVLSIPFAANIGGMGTPIGTPPNAVAMKYISSQMGISFGQWMAFAIPLVVVILLVAWLFLIFSFPATTPTINLQIKGKFLKTPKALTVYATFILTILAWLSDSVHGMNAYVVSMFPVTIFLVTGIITVKDLKIINWDVLWLVAGGIALGIGLDKSGLTKSIVLAIPFDQLSPLFIVLGASLLAIMMATLMSNTATANLLLPLVAALGTSTSSITNAGVGSVLLILAVTFSCSLAMSLPVSTPPNAIAFASGIIQGKDMMKTGAFIGIAGLLGLYGLLYLLRLVHFL